MAYWIIEFGRRLVPRIFVMLFDHRQEHASFVDRLLGDICDGVVGLVIALPVYFVVDRWLLGHTSEDGTFLAADAALWAWFLWNLTYLVGRTGESWGRKIAGLRVVGTDGGPIGFWRALGRNLFAACISAPLLYLGFLGVIWDGEKQAWHDKVFRTYVLKL